MSFNQFIIPLIFACVLLLAECLESQFDCGDGQCLYPSTVCDGKVDCESGLDEQSCFDHTTGKASGANSEPPEVKVSHSAVGKLFSAREFTISRQKLLYVTLIIRVSSKHSYEKQHNAKTIVVL